MLIQERYINDPWKLLICCIFLNRTQTIQLLSILDVFFIRYPNPKKLIKSDKKNITYSEKVTSSHTKLLASFVDTIIKGNNFSIQLQCGCRAIL